MTCQDWFQLTLKEGLTVFRDQLFSEEMTSEAVKRIEDVRVLRSAQFTEDASPMKHPIRPESYIAMDNFYTVTVYEKGAEVIRMYRTLLGADGFRKGMDLYFQRHDGSAVTCDDFRKAMADASGKNLDQFEQWYIQAGTPVVTVTGDRAPKDGKISLTLSQKNGDNETPLHIPIRAATVTKSGATSSTVFELTEKQQTLDLSAADDSAVPSLLRGFSAPVKLVFDPPLTVTELETLAAYDDDAFCKWDAWQQLATRVVLDRYRSEGDALPDYLVTAFKATLADSSAEASLRAYSLALPDYSALALDIDDGIDPQKLCAAIKRTKKDLAVAAESELRALYADLTVESGEFSVDAATVGQRRLRNACLGYLVKLDTGDKEDLLCKHFDAATCMTDTIAAAAHLVDIDTEGSASRLESFYTKAKNDNEELVINKWFSIQAMADADDALAKVQKLEKHPDFTDNPNRFRSLVSTFAAANPNNFHTSEGYDWVLSKILTMDKKNNQLAARLTNVFRSWRRYDQAHADLMKAALQTLKDTPGLSKDTLEIATRSLA